MPPQNLPNLNPDTRPTRTPALPKKGGMDQQTKNVILFAVIFSILAAAMGMYILFKPKKSEQTTQSGTGTSAQVGTTTKKSLFSFFNFFSFSPFPLGSSTSFLIPQQNNYTPTATPAPSTPTNADQTQNPREGVYGTQPTTEQLETIAGNPSSPLRGSIWISSIIHTSNANQEYLVLSTNKNLLAGTLITGMTIKSISSGQTVQIGKGVYLPVTNNQNFEEEIRVNPGETVLVASARSPLGYSFRLNKCTGYFEQFQNFTPSLPQACPLLEDEPIPKVPNQLSDKCLDYIDQFPRCQILTGNLTPTVDDQTNDCRVFVTDHTGYQNCVTRHKNDLDFYGSSWRTYLNRTLSLWKQKREIIWLLDQNGRFVSQYSY